MTAAPKTSGQRRGFMATLGRAIDAHNQFQRLNSMNDTSLAAMNLTREQIPRFIVSRL